MSIKIKYMKPIEKAKYLLDMFEVEIGCSALNVITDSHDLDEETKELSKRCALIHANEIITQLIEGSSLWLYWIKTKQEIEKL